MSLHHVVTTRTSQFFIDQNEILHIKILPEVLIDELDVYDNILVVRNLTEGKPVLKLVDTRAPNWQMTDKAKQVSKKTFKADNTIARAVLIHSTLGKNLLNFFSHFGTKECPLKYFTDEQKAVEWLLAQKK